MNKELINAAGKNGLLLGLVGAVLSLLSYLLMDVIYSGLAALVLSAILIFAVSIGTSLYLGIKWRKSIGGFVSFGNAFLFLFLMLLMAGAVNLGFEVLLYHFIEPDLQKQMGEMLMVTMEDFFISLDMPEDQMYDSLDQMEGNIQNLSLSERLMTFKWRPFVHAFSALILALFVRKEKPIFD